MLITFSDFGGTVHQTNNQNFYLEVMKRFRKYVKIKRLENWKRNSWMLHYDNAMAHSSWFIC